MSAIHPEPPTLAETPEETIFLSPRVLDEAAFERFSGSLRELVDAARQERSNLGSMVKSAETAGPRMERLAEAQRLAMKAAGDVGRKNDEVRELLLALDDRIEQARRGERDIEKNSASLHDTVARAENTLARIESLVARMDRMNTSMQSAEDAAARAESAREALERVSSKAEEVVVRSERALREYLRIAQEIAEPLAGERAGAQDAARELRAASDRCRSLVEEGAAAARSLERSLKDAEAWRGILIDAESRPTLPPALQALAEDLRAGVMRDLGEMARAMRLVADRALAVERKPIPASPAQIVVVPTPADEFAASGAD